ncbi:teneurin-3 [Lates japonicus]|uniref:Teneurin-3 n=1 Tax=Lates japonicus TaxID=270547 RepID=A0AAD3NQV0_LATJO|nr:teneurin-3 [Lates japonicus]
MGSNDLTSARPLTRHQYVHIRQVSWLQVGPSSYEVASPASQELSMCLIQMGPTTMSLVTGDYKYNFSYSNEEDVTAVTDSSGNTSVSAEIPTGCLCVWLPLTISYDSEGRLTNVTFPTGVVTNSMATCR